MHWPMSWKYAGDELYPKDDDGQILLDLDVSLLDTWRAMESCVAQGLARNIGLSNGTQRDLQTIMEECTIRPSINQVYTTLCMSSLVIYSLMHPLGRMQSISPSIWIIILLQSERCCPRCVYTSGTIQTGISRCRRPSPSNFQTDWSYAQSNPNQLGNPTRNSGYTSKSDRTAYHPKPQTCWAVA